MCSLGVMVAGRASLNSNVSAGWIPLSSKERPAWQFPQSTILWGLTLWLVSQSPQGFAEDGV